MFVHRLAHFDPVSSPSKFFRTAFHPTFVNPAMEILCPDARIYFLRCAHSTLSVTVNK